MGGHPSSNTGYRMWLRVVNRSQQAGNQLTNLHRRAPEAYRPSASLTVVSPHIRFQLFSVWRRSIIRARSCLGYFRRTQSNKDTESTTEPPTPLLPNPLVPNKTPPANH